MEKTASDPEARFSIWLPSKSLKNVQMHTEAGEHGPPEPSQSVSSEIREKHFQASTPQHPLIRISHNWITE